MHNRKGGAMFTARLDFNSFTDWLQPKSASWGNVLRPARETSALRACTVNISGPDAADRAELEQFVRESFRRVYGADVRHFMPELFSVRDYRGELLGVAGLRRAANEPLFLEVYLDQPVEAVLAARIGQPVARRDIVEIGNVAVANSGMARYLIAELVEYIHTTDIKWAVFTTIPALRNAANKMGLHLERLCKAAIGRLSPEARSEWGTYYDHAPEVMAVGRKWGQRLLQLPEFSQCFR
ncbi:MAG: thermostable hemolysin [Pseudomonadota bacterium]